MSKEQLKTEVQDPRDGGQWDEEAKEAVQEASELIGGVPPKKTRGRTKKTQSSATTQAPPETPQNQNMAPPQTERFNLQPEIKKVVKLDLQDQINITRLGNNVQLAQVELKLSESKFENASIVFDMAFKTLIAKYQIPDGWTFNLETCEFYPKDK